MIAEYEAALPSDGWPNGVLGNHDRPRVACDHTPTGDRVVLRPDEGLILAPPSVTT